MDYFIPTENDLKRIVSQSVKEAIEEILPEAIHKASRKQWLTTEEVMKVLQCSRRHIQYLRDSNQLAFTQHARTIRYKMEDVEEFLNRSHIKADKKD